jgi:glycosyltransferase involved in cell wall biosynthesis
MLFVGRLYSHARHNQKNPHFAVEIAAACMRRDESVHMLLVGGAAEPAGLRDMEERIGAGGLGNRIRLLGQRSDIPELMAASDLLLFPSLAEGLGMVAVEAQASGLPVLASRTVPAEVSVVPDIVHFLDLQDGAEAWADEALRILAKERPDRNRCNDLVASSPFAIANSARDLLQVYSSRRRDRT